MDADLPSELEHYTGIWRGQWEGTLDAVFVVLSARGEFVESYYSHGTNLIVRESGAMILQGVILSGALVFPMQGGYSMVFSPGEGGSITGLLYRPREVPSRIVMLPES